MGHKTILPDKLFFSRTADFLEVFLVKQCNKSKKTGNSYRDALTIFKRYVIYTGKNILNFNYSDCTYEYLLGFKEYLADELHYKPASINQRLAAIKSYMKYSYGCDTSLLQVYISVEAVPLSSVPKVQREILDEGGTACLLKQPPATRKGLRDTLIMAILFDAAIRLDELIQLTIGDIYQRDGFTYLLIHGKGNKERKVSIDQRTAELLDKYIKEYHPDRTELGKPLIYTVIKGEVKHMSHRNIQKILKKYAVKAEEECILPSVHPHLLRRSRASNLYQNGTPIEIVSRFLGHSCTETTKDHYAYPSLEQMRKALDSRKEDTIKQEQPLWAGHEDELAKMCGLR